MIPIASPSRTGITLNRSPSSRPSRSGGDARSGGDSQAAGGAKRGGRSAAGSQPREPKVQSIGSLVSELISRRGYAQIAATSQFHEAISKAVGPNLAAVITVGKLNRGVLKIFADDSVTIQELTFQKRAILKSIQSQMPDAKVSDLRFAVLTR